MADPTGISVDYYVRFEQGPCPNVPDALLDSVHHGPSCVDDQQISAGLRLLLQNLSTLAFVLGRLLDLLAMNEPTHALFRGVGAGGNYLGGLILDAPGKAPYANWNVAAHEAIAMLRFDAARHPHDPAVATSAVRTATSASRKTGSVAHPPSSTRSASAAPRLVPAPPSASREARAVPLPTSSAAATNTTDLD
ncbi:hypothetical protein ACIHAR_29425 [Streptomyces sp. NPDC052016]|uniref:MmyB family transcriptional regulator n=1 Tax=Streptomyces sp. NPDC052016 TaxID=3365680 RepID=UPI0037D14449